MPSRQPTRHKPTAVAVELAAGDFLTFAREGREDRRRLRWAMGAAVLAHLGLFLLTFPQVAAVIEAPPPRKVIPLRPVRFKPPPPNPQPEIPVRRAHRVPIPDPTPHRPEPIRPVLEIDTPVVLPEPPLTGIPEAPPPVETGKILRVGGDVLAPRKVFAPPPRYPEIARRAREQGLVIVEAVIDETGAVTHARIVRGLRFGLDEAALAAIERWRFEPATLNGRPVPVLYNLTINFQLQ